jgi:hypothetical protein
MPAPLFESEPKDVRNVLNRCSAKVTMKLAAQGVLSA